MINAIVVNAIVPKRTRIKRSAVGSDDGEIACRWQIALIQFTKYPDAANGPAGLHARRVLG